MEIIIRIQIEQGAIEPKVTVTTSKDAELAPSEFDDMYAIPALRLIGKQKGIENLQYVKLGKEFMQENIYFHDAKFKEFRKYYTANKATILDYFGPSAQKKLERLMQDFI